MSLTTLGMTLLVSLLLYLIDCRDVQCERRWDLLQATCQSSMQPENEHDRQLTSDSNIMTNSGSTSRSDYLIQAVRIQSVLGALVGILSLVLIAVGVGWGWTCRRLVEKRKELRTKSTQTK